MVGTVHTGNMPLPPASKLSLTDSDREQLLEISRHRSTPRGKVLRVDIVLGAAQGIANHVLARNLSTSLPTVLLWRRRFDLRRTGRSHCGCDDEDYPEGCHALECSGHGGEPEGQPRYRAADLEEAQTAAPSSGVLQVQ